MHISSSIPNGNGRIRKLGPCSYEVELIAYSKGSRYFCVEVSAGMNDGEMEISLVPDAHFRSRTFPYKCESDVWICNSKTRIWERISNVERTPERVRLSIALRGGETYLISSEPPNRYVDTVQELFSLEARYPKICSLHCLGYSMEHRPILALRITSDAVPPGEETKPVIHIVAGEHATESAGEEIARGMLSLILSEEGTSLLDRFIFDIILTSNPDGNFHGWHQYNLSDWLEHNYKDSVDRSWHHEFAPYLRGEEGGYSTETVALMEWMKLTRPACYLSMHSWEGEGGAAGAFHPKPEVLNERMAVVIEKIAGAAEAIAAELGFGFVNYPSETDYKHLSFVLMESDTAVTYLPEGNYVLGRDCLQTFGAKLLQKIATDAAIIPKDYDRSRWDRFSQVTPLEEKESRLE